ncbi:MAG: carbamoyl-phosphate synthase large subunit [Candidatus Omnitrophica bacterium]|nr:carbamoyl-phosphate synthase large subunit [Candidatus Omnitrophota bacterium]MBU1784359.1 carbamoyl-phosphate synthase large subunit [Candidatus Omnitrophota bacterium]
MPKRTDIKRILIIGSGPIVIGQACEFDFSGTQACKALKQEGFEVVLVNSNPATIMTDPEIADKTYIEPITPEVVAKIIAKERPDALLPTLGGQTGLNTAMKLCEMGVLDKFSVKMIGADYDVIKKAENRECFKEAMQKIGLDLPQSGLAHNMEQAIEVAEKIGFPLIVRPSFTLGGTGGGTAYDIEGFKELAARGLHNSMTNEILIEESIIGWKEYELEVMRDRMDNVVIVCSIENLDPMGVHTGDSITVAPQQTLSDREYQDMRDASLAIIREIGVETGGSNIQFAVNPETGRMVVIEMNPRVSRSSALASKATGFPIAKFAAKLAVGYSLDEISNDITRKTPASFEPAIDYCVVKVPRFTFEKFPGTDSTLGISMKSVGETMAIGRTFREALQKGLRGLETGKHGLDDMKKSSELDVQVLSDFISRPNADRIFYIKEAFVRGCSIDEIYALSKIDPWFLRNMKEIIDMEKEVTEALAGKLPESIASGEDIKDIVREAKRFGFSDEAMSRMMGCRETEFREARKKAGVIPTYKLVDTCAAEFEAYTPYYYSTYEDECEVTRSDRKKIMILGGGPNRIGQGIEFDYCCCHASFALKELGYETIMVNSNPETVSTDYDTSDRLYFEPLTFEDVMNIIDKERPDGVIVQFGGQTPLNLADRLEAAGVPIIGTSVRSIALAEDRKQFKALLDSLGLKQPPNGTANSTGEALKKAASIGYPVVVRPSYVLGGRAMKIVYDDEALIEFMAEAIDVSPGHPVLLDRFLENAIEIDVDALSDGEDVLVCGVMEHIEEAGIHSGDSACVLPPHNISDNIIAEIKKQTVQLALALDIEGLMNVQYAVRNNNIYVLEVNPRASRTVPFVSKATGLPMAKAAAKIMSGKRIKDMGIKDPMEGLYYTSVKESVLPFSRFSGIDIILGPEMMSTGEVMGISKNFGTAFAKAQAGAGQILPREGKVFISVRDSDKRNIVFLAKKLQDMGFTIVATLGTAKTLRNNNVKVEVIKKMRDGKPNILDIVRSGEVALIINTPIGKKPHSDGAIIRSTAVMRGIPCVTTMAGAQASVNGIESALDMEETVKSLQEYYGEIKNG